MSEIPRQRQSDDAPDSLPNQALAELFREKGGDPAEIHLEKMRQANRMWGRLVLAGVNVENIDLRDIRQAADDELEIYHLIRRRQAEDHHQRSD